MSEPPPTAAAPIVRDVSALRDVVAGHRAEGRRIGFVPTMGALHDGHLALVRAAAHGGHAVVLSIFVNPTQFAEDEDLESYPRREAEDVAAAAEAGAAVVFAPSAETMYPPGFATTVHVEGPSQGLEGAARPTHFDGVATVVTKLLIAVRPDRVVFGQKDAQQVAVIRRLMRDLHLDDADLVVAPTVRERDGLAMSSRNGYLSADERVSALAISRGLRRAEELAAAGESSGPEIEHAARRIIEEEPGCELEYVSLVDADEFTPVALITGPCVLCVAARVGSTRLIDNVLI